MTPDEAMKIILEASNDWIKAQDFLSTRNALAGRLGVALQTVSRVVEQARKAAEEGANGSDQD